MSAAGWAHQPWVLVDEHPDDVVAPHELLEHHRAHRDRLVQQLEHHPPTDPGLVDRMRRDLAAAERAIAAASVREHWTSGEGDRRLF